MKDIIEVVEELWNNPEREAERERLLAELEKRGEIERVDDIWLIATQKPDGNNSLSIQV